MKKKVDVAIIGGGPASIYAAYEFVLKYPQVSVLILEEGHAIDFRSCPIIAGKVEKCVRCTPCSIMRGFGGAGAFSDGKYNFTTEFGGWLSDYIPKKTVMDLIDYVDEINLKEAKTKLMAQVMKNLKAERKALVVLPEKDETVVRATANLAEAATTYVGTLNVYDILNAGKVVLTKAAVQAVEEVYA